MSFGKWLVVALAAVVAAGCSRRKAEEGPLVLGYFPNVTHAQALIGARDGTFERELKGQPLKTRTFNAGPAAMEALMAGELDVAYVGPGPAIVAHIRSGGRVKVIAGAASGGAGLVVKGLGGLDDLAGEKIAVPQIGNTQDIALRFWLRGQGRSDAQVTPLDNPEIVNLFRQGLLKAAWVPEPWASTLTSEGATLLVDERTLWPGGRFPTTVLVATDQALKGRREQVKAVLRAHVQLTARAKKDRAAFTKAVNDGFEALTKKRLKDEVMSSAFSHLELVTDPMQEQLQAEAEHAAALGYVPKADTSHLVDPSLLRELGAEQGVGGSGKEL